MLLDAVISLIGGALIMLSYSLPLAFAAFSALMSWIIYSKYFCRK